jgi:hypothetical protein
MIKSQYTATATAQGAGRNGTVSANGLQLNLALPKELGGSGKGENPEQLFAMGYSGACPRAPALNNSRSNSSLFTLMYSLPSRRYPSRSQEARQRRNGKERRGQPQRASWRAH